MEVIAEGLDFQGLGIVKSDKIYFIENLLPGEKAIIEVIEDKKTHAFGRVVKHLTLSENRVMAYPLSYAPLSHLSYQKQLRHQEKITQETFNKIANINIETNPILFDKKTHYKNKIVLHVKKGEFLSVGTYKAKSHILESVDKHLLATPKINQVIIELNQIFTTNNLTDDSLKQIQIKSADEILITFITNKPWQEKHYFKHLNYNLVIKENNKIIPFKGNPYIKLNFMNKQFKLYSDTFFQTNYNVAETMFDHIKDEVSGVLVDAYAGAATIGILLADKATHIYSIESNQTSYLSGLEAIQDNNIKNITPIHGKVEDKLNELEFNTLIIDPPRAGLHHSLIDVIKEKQPDKIIYISCNLRTLTRDINLLKDTYKIKSVTPVSMFPQTIETETIVILTKMEAFLL